MLTKLDEKFQAALESDTELEKQLVSLANQRRWSTIMATAMAAYIFGHAIFVLYIYRSSISAQTPFGQNVPPGMTLMPVLFLILALQYVVKAVAAHGEIRVLLAFKKLRDLSANP